MPQERLSLILKSAHLKGFKSIENLNIDFNKGLNILIGKNASGKSNFLECLFRVIGNSRISKTTYKFAELEFISSDHKIIKWISEKDIMSPNLEKENLGNRVRLIEKLFIENQLVFDNTLVEQEKYIEFNGKQVLKKGNIKIILRRMGFHSISPSYIRFNLPKNLDGIDIPGTIKIHLDEDEVDIWEELDSLTFINEIFWRIEMSYGMDLDKFKKLTKTTFLKQLKIDDSIVDNLKKYTPIEDIKFNENINIYKDEKSIIIENIKIDFKLNGNWIPWSQLSDGTKRLFYIITEITNKKNGLILVEEPELGIHPHQFNLVMDFLKEEADNKQIIISTHAPQALNHLDKDELSNILIAYFDPKRGTQIKHLSKAQMQTAKRYMEEVGFFSDYWMLSGIE